MTGLQAGLAAGLALVLMPHPAAQAEVPPAVMPGVYSIDQAQSDYMLKCQGCHRPDGIGSEATAPSFRGMLARFLAVPGGREFLIQVPGTATTNLDDKRLANLVNWALWRFDPAHLPAAFVPYTAREVGQLRRTPLRFDRIEVRNRLIAKMDGDIGKSAK